MRIKERQSFILSLFLKKTCSDTFLSLGLKKVWFVVTMMQIVNHNHKLKICKIDKEHTYFNIFIVLGCPQQIIFVFCRFNPIVYVIGKSLYSTRVYLQLTAPTAGLIVPGNPGFIYAADQKTLVRLTAGRIENLSTLQKNITV